MLREVDWPRTMRLAESVIRRLQGRSMAQEESPPVAALFDGHLTPGPSLPVRRLSELVRHPAYRDHCPLFEGRQLFFNSKAYELVD
jgi:hypothetical protein